MLRKLGTGNREIHPEIWSRWHDIVGPELAKRTLPVRLVGKKLHLAVVSSAWLHELTYLRGTIVERIADAVGPGIVREIRLILDSDMPIRPTVSLPPPPTPSASDTPLPDEISDAVGQIANPELKAQILRAAKANLKS